MKKVTVEQAINYIKKVFGDDVVIVDVEENALSVRVVWHEVGDDTKFYSNIAVSKRFGRITEISGGEC